MREASLSGFARYRHRGGLLLAATALAAAAALAAGPAASAAQNAPTAPAAPLSASLCPDAATAVFGPDVCVFTPAMTQAAIQADLDTIATAQVPAGSQFGTGRYSVLFAPGTYGSAANSLIFQVGY